MQRYAHGLGGAIDLGNSEILLTHRRSAILLVTGRNAYVLDIGAEGPINFIRPERASIDWPRDEFPKRFEIGELRMDGIMVGRLRIVHVGREPDNVLDPVVLDEAQQFCDFQLAPRRRTVVAIGPSFVGALVDVGIEVGYDERDRHVARDGFPGGSRLPDLAL